MSKSHDALHCSFPLDMFSLCIPLGVDEVIAGSQNITTGLFGLVQDQLMSYNFTEIDYRN